MRIKWLIKVTRATVFHKMSSVRSLSKAPGRKSQLHLSVRYGGNSLLSLSLFELVSYECVISQPWTVPSAAALTLAPGQPPYPGQLWAGGLTVEALPNPPPPSPVPCPDSKPDPTRIHHDHIIASWAATCSHMLTRDAQCQREDFFRCCDWGEKGPACCHSDLTVIQPVVAASARGSDDSEC